MSVRGESCPGQDQQEVDVEELKRRLMKFPPADNLEVPVGTFINQNEIDYRLSRGSGFEHGLFCIYEFL